MKKIYKQVRLFAVLTLLSVAKLSAQSYCSSQPFSTGDEEIYNFMLNGSVTNPLYSFANGCITPAPGPGSLLSRYSNFKTLGTFANLTQGIVATFSVVQDECDGPTYYAAGIAIWIDYNQNGSFSDPGEQVYVESVTTLSPRTANGTFVVPISALTGTTTMRIICAESNSGPSLTPCLSYGYGETEDYVVNINLATPCSASPIANTVIANTPTVCPSTGASLAFANSYTNSGITYAWFTSTVSNVGPWTAIPSATFITYNTPNLSTTTFYQAVVTCSNAPVSTTAAAVQVSVVPTTTSSVPYFEGFNGSSSATNVLPNCSWSRNSTVFCKTSTITAFNRSARTGSGFAFFDYGNGCNFGTNYFYSNGVQLFPGITYSAAVWYMGGGHQNLGIMYGTGQSPASQTLITSISAPNTLNGTYALLSNTFQVSSAGIYFIAVRASDNCSYNYLSIDDLSITIPCFLASNAPNVSINGPSTICDGQAANLIASGASSYTWNTGVSSSSISPTPNFQAVYSVTGMNAITGCTATVAKQVDVNPSPAIALNVNANSVCLGSSINIGATGAYSYTWSTGANQAFVTLTPTTTTTYTVLGKGPFGCIGSASHLVTVNPLPSVSVSGNRTICFGTSGNLTANGANSYEWTSNTFYLQGTTINPSPLQTNVCTVMGTDVNGCVGTFSFSLIVDVCAGISGINGTELEGVHIYPNPANDEITIELNNGITKYVELIDVTGRTILTNTSDLDVVNLNIHDLSNGIYYAKIKSNNTIAVVKVVKQ